MCMSDLKVGMHMCAPAHWIDVHGGAGEGIKGAHYVHACQLYICAFVHSCGVDRRAPVHAYVGNRHA
jgi:hypothetical protein